MIRPCIVFGLAGEASAAVLQELTMSSEVSQVLEHISYNMLGPEEDVMDFGSAKRAVMRHMDVSSAAKVLGHRDLDPDVQSMVQAVANRGEGGNLEDTTETTTFSEASLAKAREVLNTMVFKAQKELDETIMACKRDENAYRETYGQVTRDIQRLLEQINDLERVESEAVEGINTKDMEIKSVEELLEETISEYNIEYSSNSAQLQIYQNDMDVFQFIMEFTKCKEGDQLRTQDDMAGAAGATGLAQVKVCETGEGMRVFKFQDKEQTAKYEKLLTPKVKREMDRLLRAAAGPSSSLLQREAPPINHTGDKLGKHITEKVPVKNGVTIWEASLKCEKDMVPDCALLHDKLSLMWGKFKDQVDELTMIMMKNEYEFQELKTNLNNQIDVLKTAKARLNELLGEARSNLAADNEEKKQKEQQQREMDPINVKNKIRCKKKINWIFYQDICAIIIVRNAVMEDSKDCPSAKIADCDMGSWIPQSCSVSCDDSCNPMAPLECGGWRVMHRTSVVPANECGVPCPMMERGVNKMWQKCGQFKCPVDCDMSAWSGWSKCSAVCGGGVQGHTRSILEKPKNGGTKCNTVEETRPCGTISCDRNCRLAKWTPWTPCSMACNGGFQEKFRHVAIPTRGFGRCPNDGSRYRYGRRQCNTQTCVGDEICVATQDLVIALDGSGSVRTDGFEKLKAFVEKFLSRYQTEYWGDAAVRLAIVTFGNGEILEDGKTVSPAELSQPFTGDMAKVLETVKALKFQRGFTNMAQAFAMAETAFIQGARRGAQSAVMVITDGKPSFEFMTNEMVEQLDDKGIQRYMFLISEEDSQLMKEWASQPWETNFAHVPGGVDVLEADMDMWADRALVKFCPMAYSPSEMEWEEINYGYAHVKDGGYCGDKDNKNLLTAEAESAETCAALAQGAYCESFILGVSWARGKCYCGTTKVDLALFTEWLKEKKAPKCSTGWKSSTLFDFYAMEPAEEPSA